jgi:zeaxanthin glucosyltransferase
MFALGRALQSRGHSVCFFHMPAIESTVHANAIEFEPLGSATANDLAEAIRRMAASEGLHSLRFAVRCACKSTELLCEHLPAAFRRRNIDLVLADQNEPAAATVAEHLDLPFINVCPSLPLNREPDIPPPFVSWPYSATRWGRLRNFIGYRISDLLLSPINQTLNRYRGQWGLKLISGPDDTFSKLAQLCQMIPELDFPRRELPACFHYLGPFCEPAATPIPFPFERLNGRPLIYASLGTLQPSNSRYFELIAQACTGLDAQLVISTGGDTGTLPQALPGEPLVVKYAPQLDLLARATLTITHAGLNTVMQSLLCGVPMVALPITHDQPAIAARVARAGAGDAIPMKEARTSSLREAVERCMYTPSYRSSASHLSESIKLAGGVERAASIVEEALLHSDRPLGYKK